MDSEHLITAVIATPPMVQSVNRLVCYPDSLSSVPPGPPHAKRSKFPSGPAILVATDLAPLLTFDPIKCSVLLQFSTKEAGSVSRHCELVNISLKGALEGKFQPCVLEDCSTDSGNVCCSMRVMTLVLLAAQGWCYHHTHSKLHPACQMLGHVT